MNQVPDGMVLVPINLTMSKDVANRVYAIAERKGRMNKSDIDLLLGWATIHAAYALVSGGGSKEAE